MKGNNMNGRKPIGDIDITKPIPVLIEEVRLKLARLRTDLLDIGYCLGWKDRFEDVTGLLTCGISVLHGVKKEITEAEGTVRERLEQAGDLPKSYGVNIRGLGTDNTPGCFVCGGEPGPHSNISMFVGSKEDGEDIVVFFKTGARLDYRASEPNWIQVKIGACEQHLDNLKSLSRSIGTYPYRITAPMIESARQEEISP